MYIGLGLLLIMSIITVLGFSRYVLKSLKMPKLVALILILITAILRVIPDSVMNNVTIGYAGLFTALIALALWIFIGDLRIKFIEFVGIISTALGIMMYYRMGSSASEWEYIIYPLIVTVFSFVFGTSSKSSVVIAPLGVILGEALRYFIAPSGSIIIGGGYTFEYMLVGVFIAVVARRIVERISAKRRIESSYEAGEIDVREGNEE